MAFSVPSLSPRQSFLQHRRNAKLLPVAGLIFAVVGIAFFWFVFDGNSLLVDGQQDTLFVTMGILIPIGGALLGWNVARPWRALLKQPAPVVDGSTFLELVSFNGQPGLFLATSSVTLGVVFLILTGSLFVHAAVVFALAMLWTHRIDPARAQAVLEQLE